MLIYEEKKSAILALLPSISFSQNTGWNVGFSLSNISNYFQQRKRNRIELAHLQQQLLDAVVADSLALARTHQQISLNLDLLMLDIELLEIQDQLREIYSGQYQANEISTEVFLSKELNYQRSKKSIIYRLKRLHLQAIESTYPQIEILDSLLLSENFGGLGAAPPKKKNPILLRSPNLNVETLNQDGAMELLPSSVALLQCR